MTIKREADREETDEKGGDRWVREGGGERVRQRRVKIMRFNKKKRDREEKKKKRK